MDLGELMEVFRGVKICFWGGAAPCPHCGGSHGAGPDRKDTRLEAQIRYGVEQGVKTRHPKALAQWVEEQRGYLFP